MKKAKIISILIIMLSVVALGVFMGKQMFKIMEAGSTTKSTPTSQVATSSVQILYSSSTTASASSFVPAPEISAAAKPVPVETVDEIKPANKPPAESKTKAPVFSPDGPKWYAYASGNGINVRSGPGTNNKRLFKVAKGTRGVVIEKKNGWTRIKWDFNKQYGWVRDDLLVQGPAEIVSTLVEKAGDVGKIDAKQISKANAKEVLKKSKMIVAVAKEASPNETVKSYKEGDKLPELAKITADPFANIRSGAGTRNAKVAKLPKGVVVKIKNVKREGKWLWFEIEFNDGKKTGWTREDNLAF
ncbi:MAG: hypothetical protein Kow0029_16400 [Candidatus Rifleibacteriota bacterium]